VSKFNEMLYGYVTKSRERRKGYSRDRENSWRIGESSQTKQKKADVDDCMCMYVCMYVYLCIDVQKPKE